MNTYQVAIVEERAGWGAYLAGIRADYRADRATRKGAGNGAEIELSAFTRELGAAWVAYYRARQAAAPLVYHPKRDGRRRLS